MNTIVTSREAILKASRDLIQQRGWAAINIRSIANACGVSVGSIYNYFSSKSELVGATVESIWMDIFSHPEPAVFQDMQSCIQWFYQRMEYGGRTYPGFFTLHFMSFVGTDKADGKKRMQKAWQCILNGLLTALQSDPKIRPDAFDAQFTAEKFADVLFSLMLSALLQGNYDSAAVLTIVRRTLY